MPCPGPRTRSGYASGSSRSTSPRPVPSGGGGRKRLKPDAAGWPLVLQRRDQLKAQEDDVAEQVVTKKFPVL